MVSREIHLALLKSGDLPDLAFVYDPRFTIEEYEAAVESEEYKQFSGTYTTRFIDGIDKHLLGRLFELQRTIDSIKDPTEPNVPRLHKEYRETLKLTEPIINRLAKIASATNTFAGLNDLELRIYGIRDDDPDPSDTASELSPEKKSGETDG